MAATDYYQLLGVPRGASQDEIKRAFRVLAREHHPDVSGGRTESHELFIQISEAYQVLSDPDRRAAYDLSLRDHERWQQAFSGQRTYRPAPRASPRPGGRPAPRSAAPSQAAQRVRTQIEQLLQAAEAAYSLGRLRDAARLCRTVVERDPRHAAAYELLGDIFARQRNVDQALQMYTMAAQLAPYSGLLMAKLNRLLAREGGVSQRASASQPRVARTRARNLATQQVLVALLGLGAVIFIYFYYATYMSVSLEKGEGWLFVPHWTPQLLLVLVISGWVCGLTLALGGVIGPLDEELLYSSQPGAHAGAPLGVMLAVTAAIFFYLGAVVYFLLAAAQESLSRSVILVLLSAALLVGGFAGLSWYNWELAKEILLFGGNVVFLSMLAGWFIGDIFRPMWV